MGGFASCCGALVLCLALASGVAQGETGMEGILDVTAFGAKADGVTDDTAAIQKALDAAAEKGGVVYLPPARYTVKGSLKIPVGVALKGAAQAPLAIKPLIGTVILATVGRDNEDGPAVFEMDDSSTVAGLTVYYPEQKVEDIHPYSWTFRMQGLDNTIENVTLINSYNGIQVGPKPNCRHRIRSVYGCVLRRGISVDATTDIGRIENVQFHCHWWSHASTGGNWDKVYEYMWRNCEAFIFGRTDWEYVTNTFVFPCKVGYRFIGTKSGACNGQFCGIGADAANRCVVVEKIQYIGLLITNGQFVAFNGENPIEVVLEETCTGSVRLVNCAFWGASVQNVVSHGPGFLSLNDCFLSSHHDFKDAPPKPMVEAHAGKIQVRGCTFAARRPAVSLKSGVKHAIICENNGEQGVEVQHEIGDRAIISNNEPSGAK